MSFLHRPKKESRQYIFTQPNPITAFITSIKIFWEFFIGFLFIANYAKAVSFFGSARELLPEKYYQDCEELAARLSTKGFAVITGGGNGIMQSANKGAWKVGGDSVGINIYIPTEQKENKFLNSHRRFSFFFSRKTVLSCSSEIYVFFPGGFGTLDELFEMLTLIQTRHSEPLPIILYGKDFWQPLISFIEKTLADTYKTIDPEDRKLFVLFDSVDEADAYIGALHVSQSRICKIGPKKMQS